MKVFLSIEKIKHLRLCIQANSWTTCTTKGLVTFRAARSNAVLFQGKQGRYDLILGFRKMATSQVPSSSTSPGTENVNPVDGSNGEENVEPGHLIALIQMTSTEDQVKNHGLCYELIVEAKRKGAKMVFLPEAFDYIGRSKEETRQLANHIDSFYIKSYMGIAGNVKIWLSLGGFHQRLGKLEDKELPDKIMNTHILINDEGKVVGNYDKIHLYDVEASAPRILIKESDVIMPGTAVAPVVQTPIGAVGLGICYDMRFPEFALKLRLLGAEILTFPSAFMVPTGQAHWEVLIRARAIETQCYVVCAAQIGNHNNKRASYGHSMIVDPWGTIVAEAKEGDQLVYGRINTTYVRQVRNGMPVIAHRKPAIYGLNQKLFMIPKEPTFEDDFQFGHIKIKMRYAFLESENSVAFVNRKCVLPGHVLVMPKKVVERAHQLSANHADDLFEMVQFVEKIMEQIHCATSSTIAVQDGPDAGQSICHVHFHIIPRKPMDYPNNDDIYETLRKHDKDNVNWREYSEMATEAEQIRNYISLQFPNLVE